MADNADVDVQVFAIEMVYVPQGAFYAGDGTTTNITGQFRSGSHISNVPYRVTSEAGLILGGITPASLANNNATGMDVPDDFNNTTPQTLPAAYPKGYNAFYCMKYEITQQQYVDFLNTLSRVQQDTRTNVNLAPGVTFSPPYVMFEYSLPENRTGIRCDLSIHASNPIVFYCDLNNNDTGSEPDDGQWLACNYLSYQHVAAYLDWSGLRPLTELEFEKACRGTLAAVPDEYAWGSTGITQAVEFYESNMTNGGTNCETSNSPGANAVYGNNVNDHQGGPMRVGVFATGGSTRVQAGATYYGIMEMSGNVFEQLVTVGNATGRGFTGVHGNGGLSANGNANETAWPGFTAGEITGSTGIGHRGGYWFDSSSSLRLSDRYTASTFGSGRGRGGRGCRIAP